MVDMTPIISRFEKTQSLAGTSDSALLTATSVDAQYKDPDLLIREYFLSAPKQRAQIRKAIAQSIRSYLPILEILKWSINRNAADVYDGAIDLLAECNTLQAFTEATEYLITSTQLSLKQLHLSQLIGMETFWEVLLKGIACAYRIPSQARLGLLQSIFSQLPLLRNRRAVKAAMIDAVGILAGEAGVDTGQLRHYLERFADLHEPDEYIRTYAEAALADLA